MTTKMKRKVKYIIFPGWSYGNRTAVYRTADYLLRLHSIKPSECIMIDKGKRIDVAFYNCCYSILKDRIHIYPLPLNEKEPIGIKIEVDWKDLRKTLGMSAREVATDLGIKEGTYSSYENFRSSPKPILKKNMLNYFEMKISDLISRSRNERKEG